MGSLRTPHFRFLGVVALRRRAMTVMAIACVVLAGMPVVRCGSTGRRMSVSLDDSFGGKTPRRGRKRQRQKARRNTDDLFHCNTPKN